MEVDAAEQAQIEKQEELDFYLNEARKDFLFYVTTCDPDYIVSKVHILIAEELQRVANGECRRLIITIPPRIGKSRLVSQEFPTWLLGNNPKTEVIVTGYAQTLVDDHSRKARSRMGDETYQSIFKTRIADGNSQVSNWGTPEGGTYRAVGIGGGITGKGCKLLIVDDPVKDFEEAHSPTILEKIWEWFWSTAYTRLTPDGSVIIIMTRWNTDDLVGRLLDPERQRRLKEEGLRNVDEWRVINIPAICDDNDDLLHRNIGESIFPERFSADHLASTKALVGSYTWSALYTGQPTIKGGNYINVGNFQYCEEPPNLRWARYWDLAASKKETANYTAGIAGALHEGNLYLKSALRGQWEWPDARNRISGMAVAERYPIGVEAVAGFKTAAQNLREVLPSHIWCMEYGADKDKLTRALPWIAMVENKKVFLCHGQWVPDFLIECESFPNGKNDDQVDAVSGVYKMLITGLQRPVPVNIQDRLANARDMRKRRSLDA